MANAKMYDQDAVLLGCMDKVTQTQFNICNNIFVNDNIKLQVIKHVVQVLLYFLIGSFNFVHSPIFRKQELTSTLQYIDLTSTLQRPYIDPTSTPHRPDIDLTSIPLFHTPHPPPPPPFSTSCSLVANSRYNQDIIFQRKSSCSALCIAIK